jgi:hypothetical protein
MEMLELLAENEELVSDLYTKYAAKFPELKDFWQGLANEETKHAKWIRAINSQHEKGRLKINEQRFNQEAIKTHHRFLNKEINKASGDISLQSALYTALYIEKSLIEKRYFEISSGDSTKVKQTLFDLEAATNDHINRVQRVWLEHQ